MRAVLVAALVLLPVAVSAQEPKWREVATTGALVASGISATVEIVASEAGIQRGFSREVNPFLPGGRSADATAGRALIKASGTAVAVVVLHKLREKHPRWALAGSVGLAAWNGWLAANAMGHLRRGER